MVATSEPRLAKEAGCLYSPNCRQGVDSETWFRCWMLSEAQGQKESRGFYAPALVWGSRFGTEEGSNSTYLSSAYSLFTFRSVPAQLEVLLVCTNVKVHECERNATASTAEFSSPWEGSSSSCVSTAVRNPSQPLSGCEGLGMMSSSESTRVRKKVL